MDKPVIILGAGGLGKTALDILTQNNVVVYGFLDDDKALHHTLIQEVTVLGDTSDETLLQMIGDNCEVCIALEEMDKRASLTEFIKKRRKKMPINVVHYASVLESSVRLQHGNFIGANTYLGSDVQIGNHCLIHPKTTINYEAHIGDFVHFGVGSNINSGVQIANYAFIGSDVTITANVKIGEYAQVLAGSLVMQDVQPGETVFGIPARKIE